MTEKQTSTADRREAAQFREWLDASGMDNLSEREIELAEQVWLGRAARQRKTSLLTDEERQSLLTWETPHNMATAIYSKTNFALTADDPVLLAALAGVQIHEEVQTRLVKILERFLERQEGYAAAIEDAARIIQINTALNGKIKESLDKTGAAIKNYNSHAEQLARAQGQILRVDGKPDNRPLYMIGIVGLLLLLALFLFR